MDRHSGGEARAAGPHAEGRLVSLSQRAAVAERGAAATSGAGRSCGPSPPAAGSPACATTWSSAASASSFRPRARHHRSRPRSPPARGLAARSFRTEELVFRAYRYAGLLERGAGGPRSHLRERRRRVSRCPWSSSPTPTSARGDRERMERAVQYARAGSLPIPGCGGRCWICCGRRRDTARSRRNRTPSHRRSTLRATYTRPAYPLKFQGYGIPGPARPPRPGA